MKGTRKYERVIWEKGAGVGGSGKKDYYAFTFHLGQNFGIAEG